MVLTSAYESYGIVYVEAQQFGLPFIGTTAGADREIISHGDNGYLIPLKTSMPWPISCKNCIMTTSFYCN